MPGFGHPWQKRVLRPDKGMGPDSIEGVDERRDEARAEIEVQVDGDHPAPAEGLCEGGDGGHSGGIDDDGMDEVGILGQGY